METQSIGLSEFVKLSGISKATILRHLKALEECSFVKQDNKTKKYQLGYKILELAYILKNQFTLRELMLPYMEKLRNISEETVCLTIEDEGEGINIERLESYNKLVYLPPIGSKEPLYAGASRKILLAFLPEDKVLQIVEDGLIKVSKNTITDYEILMKEIQIIRKQGYAISEEEHVHGVSAIAAPIKGSDGKVIASLSIVGPSFRLTEEQKRNHLSSLLEITKIISKELGCNEI